MLKSISIRGAREHNLKNINVDNDFASLRATMVKSGMI